MGLHTTGVSFRLVSLCSGRVAMFLCSEWLAWLSEGLSISISSVYICDLLSHGKKVLKLIYVCVPNARHVNILCLDYP